MSHHASPARLSRRSVLNVLLSVGVLGWLASVLYPVIRYLTPLPLVGPGGPVQLTRSEVTKIERDKFAIVPVGRRRVLVLEDSEGELRALDAKCTHEGCTVKYMPRDSLIVCACHNGRFDLQGRVVAGPPPKPLATYAVQRDEEGVIKVTV
ncbi:MAG: Rieske (2Fe-2S) protein [Myxococcales bacterium]|nr:Rieske (2Fe-2S) protein [Myxococcales bacterium]